MKRGMKITFMLAAISFAMSSLTNGEIVTYELPAAFEREYNRGIPYLQMDFDLGVTFTEISNVYIDWSGEITAGLAVHNDDPCGVPFPLDVGIYASLGFNPSVRRTEIRKGAETYPDAATFDELSQFELSGSTTWSDLLDGQGTITIGYTEPIMLDDTYVEHGLVVLNDASLLVEGVVVPEVSTLLFLGMGGLALRIS